MDIVNLVFAILGIGFLIFIHELGHFVAAKKVGIRVETFALGFQPTIMGWKARILAFKRGDTEYVIGLLPFGGYVKMAGEELDDPRTGSDDEYASKSHSQRAIVLVAGATMNLIFGFLLFILAFSMGVSFPSTKIGMVIPGDPAWIAGIRPGDKIIEIDGDPKRDFTSLQTSIALSSEGRELKVTLERPSPGGGPVELMETTVRPKLDQDRGLLGIGVTPATGATITGVEANGAAAAANLIAGDVIRKMTFEWENGRSFEVPEEWVFDRMYTALRVFTQSARAGTVELVVDREDGDATRPVKARIALESKSVEELAPKLGVLLPQRRVKSVLPGCGLEEAFPIGAEIVSVNGTPVYTFDLWSVLANEQPGSATVTIGFRDGSERSVVRDILLPALADSAGSLLQIVPGPPFVSSVDSDGIAKRLGLEVGDEVLAIGDQMTSRLPTEKDLFESGTTVTWRRGEDEFSGSVAAKEREALGATLAHSAILGRIVSGGAAERGGLLAGDQVLRAGDKELRSWDEMTEAIGAATKDKTTQALALTVLRNGEQIPITVTPDRHWTSLGIGLGPEQFKLQTSIGGGISEGWSQSVVWAQRIFLMLGSLARRDVSPKNLAGPIGIVHIGKKVADEGLSKLFYVLAMISINLGVFNLLPFPILDGGHLFFLLIEKIKGTPVNENIQGWVHLGAFVILIGLALFVTYHDILRLFGIG